MKKVIVIVSMFLFAFSANVSAQLSAGTPGKTEYLEYKLENVMISSIKMKEGESTVQVPNGRGTIKFVKRGDKFSDVVYTDAAGKTTRLAPHSGSTEHAPKLPCKYKIPDACFGSADKSVFMCMCRPTDIADANDPVTIGLLLPAVQKVREAAARMSTN